MSKKALGKGIGALFTEIDDPQIKNSLTQIAIDLLQPNPYQPRKEFHAESLQELADSIKENGIIQPILAEATEDNHYIIIAGERRVRAAKLAGLTQVPAILHTYTKEEKLEIALIENIQREDLSPIEEALGYKNIIEVLSLNQEEVAKKVGKKRSTVANSLRLLKLPDPMQAALNTGTITAGHARAILSLLNPGDQELLYSKITAGSLSVREAERQASEFNKGHKILTTKKSSHQPGGHIPPELEEIKQKFIDTFGTKIEIKGNIKKGKIEISYFSMDDLERIIDIVGK